MKRKNILIIGCGISGFGAAKLCVHLNYKTFVTSIDQIEKNKRDILLDLGVQIEEGIHSISNLDEIDLIIKSPGVSQNINLLNDAKNRQIPVVSEIEFASRFTNSHLVAITGTNGKTTTSTLLYHILKTAGLRVDLVGNIGKSFSESIIEDNFDYYVLEVSSFQLEYIITFKPNISILLNLEKDHLDRYNNNFQEYIQTKLKIQMNQSEKDDFIYFADDIHINNHLNSIIANKYPFGNLNPNNIKYGGWLENGTININTIQNNFTMTIHNLALQGTHNFYNSMAASIAASSMGIKNEIIKKSLSDFKGVEHRLEFVRKISGINFINDSKATNCNSVYYALETIKSPIIWICGGVDKGNDYSLLKDLVINKVKTIICVGNKSKKIQNNFKSLVNDFILADTMKDAVKFSYSNANLGDTVLLSPACASFDLFKDYEERGQVFKSCVLGI